MPSARPARPPGGRPKRPEFRSAPGPVPGAGAVTLVARGDVMTASRTLIVSKRWLQAAVATFAGGFAVLVWLAFAIDRGQPPIPAETVAPDGEVLFTADDVLAGQHLFLQHGLMEYGTIFGHGAYLGPDFTSQYLHGALEAVRERHAGTDAAPAAGRAQEVWQTNRGGSRSRPTRRRPSTP